MPGPEGDVIPGRRHDAERACEDCGWDLAGELPPCGQPARPGRDAELAKHADEPVVAGLSAS
jgi:hypothetical protein